MKRPQAVFASAVMIVALCAVGCSIKLNYDGLQGGSPLKGIPPKTFVIDPFTGDHGDRRVFSGDKPAKDMVRDAIRQELERNGHTCVPEAAVTRADFRISGAVYEWSIYQAPTAGLNVAYGFAVGMKVLATRLAPGGPEFSKKYEGSYRNERLGTPSSLTLANEAFEAAFTMMLRDFTTDPEFLTFLAAQ
jgi:hypothetical protein